MPITINTTGQEAWSGTPYLGVGSHNVRVTGAEEATAGTGNPQIILNLEAIDGAEQGGVIRDWITVTDRSIGRVMMILQALGVEVTEGDFTFSAEQLVGKTARIVVRENTYEGKTRNKVMGYEPLGATYAESPAAPQEDVDIPF